MDRLKGRQNIFFGKSRKDEENMKITAPTSKNGLNIHIEEIDLKDKWERGKPKTGKLSGKKTTKIWPLINLDIYAEPVKRVGIGSSIKVSGTLTKLGIEITIPKKFIEQLVGKQNFGKIKNLYFYSADGTWVNAQNDSCVVTGTFDKKGPVYKFTIDSWPTDDRMVGCGG